MPTSIKKIGIAIALAGVALMAIAGKDAVAEPMWVTQYGPAYCGLTTASGETHDCGGYTAASPYLPFGSMVRVCYEGCVDVRVNDACDCTLDLSDAAALEIGLPGADVAEVTPL